MKKLLCLLMTMMMVLGMPAALAEADDAQLWLNNYLIEQLDEQTVRVQMLFIKDGAAAYRMEDATLVLYNAAGEVIPVASQEQVLFPLKTAPAGRHYMLMTVDCTLAETAEAVDFDVLSVTGIDLSMSDTIELDWSLPYLGVWMEDCLSLTAWMPMEPDTRAEDYFAVLIAVDDEGYFMGNAELAQGSAREVAAADIFDEIFEATTYTEDWLLENGYRFEHERYAFFENARMDKLSVMPSGLAARSYRAMEEAHAQPIVTAFDRIFMQEDGSFVIHGCLENTSDSLWRLEAFTQLCLYDAQGRTAACAEFVCDTPFSVINPGEYLPYSIEGRVEAGFAADRFQAGFKISPAEAPDHRSIEGGMTIPSFNGDLTLSASMPAEEGIAPEDCFLCVMFIDFVDEDYHGAAWTYVNEAWLQEGEIRFPTLDAPEYAERTDAMLLSWYVAE